MNCDRRLFILSMFLSLGLASSSVYADYSVTEICAATWKSEGQLALFNADSVIIVVTHPDDDEDPENPLSPTRPVCVDAHQTFCVAPPDGTAGECERTGKWTFAIGDDFPLDGLGLGPAPACDYRFGPGAFDSLDTVGDMSTMTRFCMVVHNIDDNSVCVRMLIFTSIGKAGIALQIRTFAQSELVWIGPDKAATVCIDFNNAEVQPSFAPGQTVPNTNNVTGFGIELGALTPFTETRKECLDNNKDNDPNDCLNARPAGCGDCKLENYLNRESDDVQVKLAQPRPQFLLETQNLVYCNSQTLQASFKNNGTGSLTISEANLGGANPGEFEVVAGQLPLSVPPNGGTAKLNIRYNNREPGRHTATVTFKSNGIDPATNQPVDHSLAGNILDLHAFSTASQAIVTQQDSATIFRAYVNLKISTFAPTGYDNTGEGDLIPDGCGKLTQLPSIGTRLRFDQVTLQVILVEKGRPNVNANGPASGIEYIPEPGDTAPNAGAVSLPGSVVAGDPPQVIDNNWTIIFHDMADANVNGLLSATASDIGGRVIDTAQYLAVGPVVNGVVTIESFCITFELVTTGGCNTASVRFGTGPSNNFFPQGHQSNVGSNPDVGTTILQDVGANSASNLGIPENAYGRGDADLNAVYNLQDVVTILDANFNTDGSDAQIIALVGHDCLGALDITVDHRIDFRDTVTLIQLLFNITSLISSSDIVVLWDKAGNQDEASPVSWPGFGFEKLLPDKDGHLVVPDPDRYINGTCLQCNNGVVIR